MPEKLEALMREFRAARYPDGFCGRDVTGEFTRWASANRPEELAEAKDEAFDEWVDGIADAAIQEAVDAGELRRTLRPKADGTVDIFCYPVGPGSKAGGGTQKN